MADNDTVTPILADDGDDIAPEAGAVQDIRKSALVPVRVNPRLLDGEASP